MIYGSVTPLCHPDCHVTGVLSPLTDMTVGCVNQRSKQMLDLTFDGFMTGFMMFLSLTFAMGVFMAFLPELASSLEVLGSS